MIILSFIWPLYPIPFRNKPKMAYSRNLSKMAIKADKGLSWSIATENHNINWNIQFMFGKKV